LKTKRHTKLNIFTLCKKTKVGHGGNKEKQHKEKYAYYTNNIIRTI